MPNTAPYNWIGRPYDLGAAPTGATKTYSYSSLLNHFTDDDGDYIFVDEASLSADHGTIVNNFDGTFNLILDPAYNGTVHLTYNVSDSQATAAGEADLKVAPARTTLDFSATGLTGDFDGDPLTPDTHATSVYFYAYAAFPGFDGLLYVSTPYSFSDAPNFHESDFTYDPSIITTYIGTSGDDGFDIANSPRSMHIYAGAGDDLVRFGKDGNLYPSYFDGGSGYNTVQMGAGYSGIEGVAINFNLVDASGYAAVLWTVPASIEPGYGTQVVGYVKNVSRIGTWFDGGDDTINASNQTIDMTFQTFGGTDSVTAGSGNDTYLAWFGDETFVGGTGSDTLNFANSGYGSNHLIIDLEQLTAGYAVGTASWTWGGGNQSGIYRLSGVENITGTSGQTGFLGADDGNDVIKGDAQANAFTGDWGDDVLHGRAGNDTLEGGYGNDVLWGGAYRSVTSGATDDDTLTGGAGNDTLYGDAPTGQSLGTIVDNDTAVYRGNHTDYTFTAIADASGISGVQITDNRDPSLMFDAEFDATDRVFQVENFRFADGTFTLAQLGVGSPPTNHAPVANVDAFTTAEDTAKTGNVLTNDTDADGNTLTAVVVTGPSHGTLTLNANGSFTYTPNANYNGADSFTYKANDGTADSNVATVNLTVTPVNDAPDAVDNSGYTTAFNTALNLAKATLLANDTDVDGDTLTVTSVSNASHGTVTISGNTVVFTPVTGYSGAAGFDYTISDGHGGTDTAHVSLTVNPQSTGGTTYNPLTNGDDTVSFATATGPVLVGGLNGNDSITGSRFADTLNGGAGNDLLNGGAGKDVIIGGKGYDRVMGGADNDTFVFAAGDLSTTSQVDHIMDFSGAGIAQTGAGEQDFIRFTGFGTGATLQFDHYGNAAHTLQYYRVVDPANSANGGLILVQMAGGNTNQLISGDYHFY